MKPTVKGNSVYYKEVKGRQTEIESNMKVEHEDVEKKGPTGKKKSR